MQRVIDDTNCYLFGTEYCDLLNWSACKTCPIKLHRSKDSRDEVVKSFEVLMSLVPEEGIAPIFKTDDCQFCKGKPGKKSGYFMVLIGHKEPKTIQRSLLGTKTEIQAGSILPVYISCCPRCHRNHLLVRNVPALSAVGLTLVSFLILAIGNFTYPTPFLGSLLPLLILVVSVVGGYFLGVALGRRIERRVTTQTILNPWEIPLLAKFKRLGWFPMEEKRSVQQMIFTRNRAREGVYSSEKSKGKAHIS